MKLPKIYIKNAWLLRENASKHLHELWAESGEKLSGDSEMDKIVKRYRKAWLPKEKRILSGMCETLELEFKHNIIDVYIAPWFYAFSDPLVIGVRNNPDEFIDTLTHELVHRLLTVNDAFDINLDEGKLNWTNLFGKTHSFTTLVHIPVHAVMKAIYLDILKEPKRLERDKRLSETLKDYSLSWQYVDENGYQEIISKLKKSYKNLA